MLRELDDTDIRPAGATRVGANGDEHHSSCWVASVTEPLDRNGPPEAQSGLPRLVRLGGQLGFCELLRPWSLVELGHQFVGSLRADPIGWNLHPALHAIGGKNEVHLTA